MSAPTTTVEQIPAKSGSVLTALILTALVCNINLAVANVALPAIGKNFEASQTSLNIIAIGCTLGLAMSVLYFGAIGDRYGRKRMLVIGLSGTIVASLLSATAASADLLSVYRLLTGLAAGMAYPTTLALITALWGPGIKRTKAIALWSGVSAGAASLGPAIAGVLLTFLWWGSVFLIALPIAIIALFLVLKSVPSGVNESTEKVDNLGGVLSVVMIGSLVLAVSFFGSLVTRELSFYLLGVAVVFGVLFFWRQRTAQNPLYDLSVAKRRLFWVPAVGGMIVFGSLMGAAFIGQQFLQNVAGLTTALTGLTGLPSAVALIIAAQLSARLIINRGSRVTMVSGYAFVFIAFLVMFSWGEKTGIFPVILAYVLIGFGAGLALTPASRSLTGSTPIRRVGMASGTSDLQRDLGGSIMQALLGSILVAGFSASFAKQIASSSDASSVTAQISAQLESSFSSAAAVAASYPQYSTEIMAAAKEAFLSGSNFAFIIGAAAVLIGAAVVLFGLPNQKGENALMEQYEKEDAQ